MDADPTKGVLVNVEIHEIMQHPVMTGTPHQTAEHVRAVMAEHGVSAFPIVDSDGAPVGIVTAVDLLHDHPDGAPVSGFMTSPVLTVPQYEQPHTAARIMRNHHIHHVVVTDAQQVVGMLSAYDLLQLVEDHRFIKKPGPTPSKKHRQRE